MSWHVNILTLFPEMFPGALGTSLSGKALEAGAWSYTAINIRDFARGVHKSVDDAPYGGGAGMVMRADVIEKALLSVHPELSSLRKQGSGNQEPEDNPIPAQGGDDNVRLIYLSPRGKPLTQNLVQELAETPEITLLCGRYEGVDQRALDAHEFEEISIGDYVLSGGEPAALILMDACIRLLPGVMGNAETPLEESFSENAEGERLLEYPHYTRPAEWESANGKILSVPETLISGNHKKIKEWRETQSRAITKARRPDLLGGY